MIHAIEYVMTGAVLMGSVALRMMANMSRRDDTGAIKWRER